MGVSLISDLFSSNHQGTATGIFHWGIYFGYGLSYALGVYVTRADFFGMGWRCCFFMAGLPGIFIGLLLLFSPDVHGNKRRKIVEMSEFNRDTTTKKTKKEEVEAAGEASDEERTQLKAGADDGGEPRSSCRSSRAESSSRMISALVSAFLQPILLILFVAASFRHAGELRRAF